MTKIGESWAAADDLDSHRAITISFENHQKKDLPDCDRPMRTSVVGDGLRFTKYVSYLVRNGRGGMGRISHRMIALRGWRRWPLFKGTELYSRGCVFVFTDKSILI